MTNRRDSAELESAFLHLIQEGAPVPGGLQFYILTTASGT